jgi:hypothetical protein
MPIGFVMSKKGRRCRQPTTPLEKSAELARLQITAELDGVDHHNLACDNSSPANGNSVRRIDDPSVLPDAEVARREQGLRRDNRASRVEVLRRDLKHQWERAHAMCVADRFGRWLLFHVAEHGIPLDGCLTAVTLLPVYVEVYLLAAVTWPELFADWRPGVDSEQEDEAGVADDRGWAGAPRNVDEASATGLTVGPRPRPERLPPPTLPGCQWSDDSGLPCIHLRRYGERFCPGHMEAERQRLRMERR